MQRKSSPNGVCAGEGACANATRAIATLCFTCTHHERLRLSTSYARKVRYMTDAELIELAAHFPQTIPMIDLAVESE